MKSPRRDSGFTLVEAIVVIVILAIVSSVVAVFIRGPVQGYFDSARRAGMSDVADTALRRMARDVRLAVPNSVRATLSGGVYYLEFVPTLSGGQYRQNDVCFTSGVGGGCVQIAALNGVLSGAAAGNSIAIYNTNNNAAADCSGNAPSIYCGQNRAAITGVAAAADATYGSAEINLNFASMVFNPSLAASMPGQRFQIFSGPVSYACAPAVTGTDGSGTLTRYSGYALQAAQPTAFGAGVGHALLAGNVSGCTISYTDGVLGNRGLITLWLTIMTQGESVSLMQQVHVDNTP